MGFEKREEREKDIEIEKPYQFANLVAVRDPIAILKKSFFLNSLSLTLNFSSSPHSPVAGGGGAASPLLPLGFPPPSLFTSLPPTVTLPLRLLPLRFLLFLFFCIHKTNG